MESRRMGKDKTKKREKERQRNGKKPRKKDRKRRRKVSSTNALAFKSEKRNEIMKKYSFHCYFSFYAAE